MSRNSVDVETNKIVWGKREPEYFFFKTCTATIRDEGGGTEGRTSQ